MKAENRPLYLLAVGIVSIGLFLALLAYVLYQKEYTKMEAAAHSLSHTNMLLLESQLKNMDATITTISQEYLANPTLEAAKKVFELFKHHKMTNPLIYEMGILNASGEIVAWSRDEKPPFVKDRDYVEQHLKNQNSASYLSPPVLSRTSKDKWVLIFSRAFRDSGGALLGIGVGIFDVSALEVLFDSHRENESFASSLIHNDGTIILRTPRLGSITGQKATFMNLIDKEQDMQSVLVSNARDGKDRLAFLHYIREYDIYTAGTVDMEEWLSEWRNSITVLFGLWLLLLVLGVFGARNWRRYIIQEDRYLAELKDAQQELEETNQNLEYRIEEELEAKIEKERLLIQSSKMGAMGELTNHIAHHWRQPLSVILLSIQDLEYFYFEQRDDAGFKQKAEHAKNSIQKISEMISKLGSFYRTSSNPTLFRLDDSIKKVIDFYQNSHYDPISISLQEEANITLYGYPVDLEHAILQIIINAKDIMIERKIAYPIVTITTKNDGGACNITIKDNGGGIDSAIMDRIFEPYFTTKFPTVGTGLSLYVAYHIIKNLFQGNIKVNNSKDGAIFELSFPITEAPKQGLL